MWFVMTHNGKFCQKSGLLQRKIMEKLLIGQNWPSQVILSHFSGKTLEKLQSGEIGHSKSFRATLVGKDWKSCKLGKMGHSELF